MIIPSNAIHIMHVIRFLEEFIEFVQTNYLIEKIQNHFQRLPYVKYYVLQH